MSCRRSAIINISTVISSVKKCPETFSMAPMYPYRTSKAPLAAQDSVLGLLSVMSSLSNKDSGMFIDWQGNSIPW
uniref:Uncharacterized protein n=1 Tax=Seriola lalandi dorsalis TaxID=1841481 RepID=A0A3B4WFX5_SERLL